MVHDISTFQCRRVQLSAADRMMLQAIFAHLEAQRSPTATWTTYRHTEYDGQQTGYEYIFNNADLKVSTPSQAEAAVLLKLVEGIISNCVPANASSNNTYVKDIADMLMEMADPDSQDAGIQRLQAYCMGEAPFDAAVFCRVIAEQDGHVTDTDLTPQDLYHAHPANYQDVLAYLRSELCETKNMITLASLRTYFGLA